MPKNWNLLSCVLAIVCLTNAIHPAKALAQGAMTNGANHTGTIVTLGGTDTWTFSANQGDTVLLSIARTGGDANFAPEAQVRNPNNVLIGTAGGTTTAGQIQLSITVTGTHTVSVLDNPGGGAFVGSYALRMAKTPGAFITPGGDDGGAMTNG